MVISLKYYKMEKEYFNELVRNYSKLLGTTVGVKIKDHISIGALIKIYWDKDLQISQILISNEEGNQELYNLNTEIKPYFDEDANIVIYTAL